MMHTRFESYLNTQELYKKKDVEHEIFYQVWKSSQGKTQGLVLVTHGLSEHSGGYQEFSKTLNEWGWDVVVWDLPGHGRSSGKRGVIEDFEDFLKEQNFFLNWTLKNLASPHKPLVLFSHSLGALITLKGLLIYGERKIQALCLSAPCVSLALKPFWFKRLFAHVAALFCPPVTLYNEIEYRNLTHEEQVIKQYASDPYRHNRISARLFLGLVHSSAFVRQKASLFSLPLLLQWGEKDPIIDLQEVKKFYKTLKCSLKRCHNL